MGPKAHDRSVRSRCPSVSTRRPLPPPAREAILSNELYVFAGIPKGQEEAEGSPVHAQALIDAIDAGVVDEEPIRDRALSEGHVRSRRCGGRRQHRG